MKRIYPYLSIFILSFYAKCKDNSKIISEPYVRYNQNIAYGKIKMITEEHFLIVSERKFGELKKTKEQNGKDIYIYNENNNLIKHTFEKKYFIDSSVNFYKNDLLILEKHWTTAGDWFASKNYMDYLIEYENSNNGKKIKKIKNYYDLDGQLKTEYSLHDYFTVSNYDDNNFLIKDDVYKRNGSLDYSKEYNNDNAGNYLYNISSEFNRRSSEFIYDKKNNLVSDGTVKYSYFNYDLNNNWLKKTWIGETQFQLEATVETIRKIDYY
jgi:hypothetical protein